MLEITLELKNTILDTFKIDKDEITIGRNMANDITIDNLAVSDRHARIVRDKTGYYLEDLKSTNGTFVDGRKISRIGLEEQQDITIGKHSLDVRISSAKTADPDFARTMKIDRS
ncbi:MAG: FHA domain-containing protein [Desulfobacterales bacterium]|jgi:pSer/pThr/pTyr-binding forkhead associated (FHA) protein